MLLEKVIHERTGKKKERKTKNSCKQFLVLPTIIHMRDARFNLSLVDIMRVVVFGINHFLVIVAGIPAQGL